MVNPAHAQLSNSHSPTQLIDQLGRVCADNGLPDLATRLVALRNWLHDDLRNFETELAVIPRGARLVQQAAHHLLDLSGKHLRPMCVALAAKVGSGFDDNARHLAIAVELVHTATLLHDDVIDVGDVRRGAPAARCIYGNAASVFAGDWLLVEALKRVRKTGMDDLLGMLLDIIDEMIMAESLQLERRGHVVADIDTYFRVVEGKTASVFRWALYAGGRAGGLAVEKCEQLSKFGQDLGVAFQVIDDLLDFRGEEAATGKTLFVDLGEGKMTYPLALAIEREPHVAELVRDYINGAQEQRNSSVALRAILAALERTGALTECRQFVDERIARAISHLDAIEDGPAKSALVTVAHATLHRER